MFFTTAVRLLVMVTCNAVRLLVMGPVFSCSVRSLFNTFASTENVNYKKTFAQVQHLSKYIHHVETIRKLNSRQP